MESRFTKEDFELIDKEFESLWKLAVERCRNDEEAAVVKRAFEFANKAHQDVRRRSGLPYMIHPIAVAKIVVSEIGLGYKSIAAALLHDVVEDTEYTVEDINHFFGPKIASLVEGLTKIKIVLDSEDKKGTVISAESLQAENLKRILLTLNEDVRVVLIKLADRLHNCRTIDAMPEHKRDKILSETMFIFIPLAHRLGLYSIKSEMENIWLRYKEPDAYNSIVQKVDELVHERQKAIDDFVAPIFGALRRDDFDFEIKQRIKTPYSIWHKMQTKGVPFEQVYDIFAVRIVFDPGTDNHEIERKQAYMIYADVIGIYKEKPGRHRDWIETPKTNGYEALHSTMMSQAGIWVEVQIRSKRMDDIAEHGIAAHWAYKRGGYASETESKMDKWLAKVQEILTNKDVSAFELLDIVHSDLVSSEIVVFTPKGDQKTIVNGATALDFAYSIHSRIGDSAVAAKINMKLSPLSQILKAGDQVEIITSSDSEPKMEWLQFLKTRKAKGFVVDHFHPRRPEIIAEGQKIYTERLAAMGLKDNSEVMRKIQFFTNIRDRDEILFQVGLGIIGPAQFKTIFNSISNGNDDLSQLIKSDKFGDKVKYVAANCCKPIPGDPIVGFLTDDSTVIVHKKICDNTEWLGSTQGKKLVALEWKYLNHDFPVKISITGMDKLGLLNEITHFISLTMGINMRKLALGCENGIFQGSIELLVKDKNNLVNMIEGLKRIDGVQDVVRTDL